MKVLHLIARMNVGGTARYLSMLSNGLKTQGIESSIASGYVQGAEAEDSSVNSVKLHRVKHLGRAINPISDHLAMKEFMALVAVEKPDIIHTHTFKAGFIARSKKLSLIKSAGKDINFVHTFHGHLLDDPEFKGIKKSAIIAIERALAKKAEKLITVGQRVADELLENEIGNPSQYVNIPPGVTPLNLIDRQEARKRLQLPTDKLIVGWLARVTRVKNPVLAIKVAEQMPNVHFAFGGEGDLFEQLKAKELANTTILGWVDAAIFMSACDVILSTSENEGMPVALIEAQLGGKPVIATNVGSVAEVVIDGQTGFVTEKSLDHLVLKLKTVIADPRLIPEMGQAAKTHAIKAFSPEAMIQKHLDLYRLLA